MKKRNYKEPTKKVDETSKKRKKNAESFPIIEAESD